MRVILKVRDKGVSKYLRYLYTVENDKGKILCKRNSRRKYVACLVRQVSGFDPDAGFYCPNYFGRRDLIKNGWNGSLFKYLDGNKVPYWIAYTKEEIDKMVEEKYNISIQDALNEADKHATVVDKYCSACDNYHPSFKDEKYCLICGSAHDGRKDPDLAIPLENKE